MRKRLYTALERSNVSYFREREDDAPVALVHNIVATTQIISSMMPIDLQGIADVLPNSFYDRQRFAAITIRIQDPTCTALLFTSGKLVLTGCKGWNECILASIHVVQMLKRYNSGVDFAVHENTIQNIVGHVEVPLQKDQILDLDLLYTTHCTHCTYQRNMFPGLIYRPDKSPIVLLCFYSGKIVITGGKCIEDIEIGWRRLWPLLKTYVK
jgi:transcription initiation factor TFIID TATA-box-binding protein